MDEYCFTPGMTTWHITWGTYGTRLHGGERATVDKRHNRRGEAFVGPDAERYAAAKGRMRFPAVRLTMEQRRRVQEVMPALCERGGWRLRECAAATDHVHVLLDVDPAVHGEKVRRLLKRWVTQALNEVWEPGSGRPGSLGVGARWWAEEGSNRAIRELAWLNRAHPYVREQRA